MRQDVERGLLEVDDDDDDDDDDETAKSLTVVEPLCCTLTLDHAGDDVSEIVVHVAFSKLTMVVAPLVHLDDYDVDVDANLEPISSDRTCC